MQDNKDFYQIIPKKYVKPIHTYDNYDRLKIQLPVRAVIAGSSGTGKTLAVMNFIDQFNCFDKFYLFIADTNEPLYKFLIDYVTEKFGAKNIFISDSIADMPEVEEFDGECNNLIIIDDMLNEKDKDQLNAVNVYIKGRRKNCSIVYITQDFFKTIITIRKNSKVVILTRFDDPMDLENILKKYKGRGLTMSQILKMYHYATDGDLKNFFLIDCEAKGSLRLRKNFTPILMPQ